MQATPIAPSTARREHIFTPWLIIALAVFAVPRVVAHDLRLVEPGSLANSLLVFVPALIWLAVILWRRPTRPFLTGLLLGVCYGIFLAIAHQLMWTTVFGDNPPRIGGTLAGGLDPLIEGFILRAAAFISSILTGVVTGLLVGAVAAGLAWVQRRFVPS